MTTRKAIRRVRRWLLGAVAVCGMGAGSAMAVQTVFLDFDSQTGGGEIMYTPMMRDDVQAQMQGHYSLFDFAFTQTAPAMGDFSTVTFNAGSPGGEAEQIDFGNIDMNDNAVINVNGLGGVNTTAEIVAASAVIGSHELGHLVGLRHGDSFGEPGTGVHAPPGAGPFDPNYPGPINAPETTEHIMASPASVGSSISDLFNEPVFSERSATKLTYNEVGVEEMEFGDAGDMSLTAQPLSVGLLDIPNTLKSGQANFGKDLVADYLSVAGDILTPGDMDMYMFSLDEPGTWTFQLMSSVIDQQVTGTIDTILEAFGSDGSTYVDYYGTDARNDDEFEGSTDSLLLDLIFPSAGDYFLKVSAATTADIGGYRLFGYNVREATQVMETLVPEPATAMLGAIALGGLGLVTRRRRRA